MSNKNRFRDSMKHASRLPTSLCQDNHRMILAGWSGPLVLLVSMLGHAKVSQAAPASQLMAAECAETCQAHYDTCAEACLTQPASQDDTGASGDDPFACHNKCLEVYTSVYEDIFHACYVERQKCSNAIYSRLNPDGSLYCGGGVLFGSMHCSEEDQEKCEPPYQACLRPADVAQEACLAWCTPQPAAPAADEACMNTCQHNQDACVRQCQHPLHGDDSLGFEPLYCMGSEPVPPAEGAPPAEGEGPSQAKEDQEMAAVREDVRRAEAELSQRRDALGHAQRTRTALQRQLESVDYTLKEYEGQERPFARDLRDRLTNERARIQEDLRLAQAAYDAAYPEVGKAEAAMGRALRRLYDVRYAEDDARRARQFLERQEAEARQRQAEANQRAWREFQGAYPEFARRKAERLIPQTICFTREGIPCAAGDVKKETYECGYVAMAPGQVPTIGRMGERLEQSEVAGFRRLLGLLDLYQDTLGLVVDLLPRRLQTIPIEHDPPLPREPELAELERTSRRPPQPQPDPRTIKPVPRQPRPFRQRPAARIRGLPTPDLTFPGMSEFPDEMLQAIENIPKRFGVILQVTFPVTVKHYEFTDTFTCLESGPCGVVPWDKKTARALMNETTEQVTLYCSEHYRDCAPKDGEALANFLATLADRALYEALMDSGIVSDPACPSSP